MHRNNVKHVNITEMILAKQREQQEAEQRKAESVETAIETASLLVALGIILTFLVLLVCYQEGLL
jgi:hypothetical protein